MYGYANEELFALPVTYRGEEMILPARMVRVGYFYKIYVTVKQVEVMFETDEEHNFRAVGDGSSFAVPADMLSVISESLEKNLR